MGRIRLSDDLEVCGIVWQDWHEAMADADLMPFDAWRAKWCRSGDEESARMVYDNGPLVLYCALHVN